MSNEDVTSCEDVTSWSGQVYPRTEGPWSALTISTHVRLCGQALGAERGKTGSLVVGLLRRKTR